MNHSQIDRYRLMETLSIVGAAFGNSERNVEDSEQISGTERLYQMATDAVAEEKTDRFHSYQWRLAVNNR